MLAVRAGDICTTREHLDEIVAAYMELDEFVFDVETRGPYRNRPERNEVAWIGLAGPGRSDVIPMGHINGKRIKKMSQRRVPLVIDGEPQLTPKGNPRYTVENVPGLFTPPPKQLWPSEVFGALEPLFFSERRKIGQNVKFDLGSVAKYYGGRVPPRPYGDTAVVAHLLDEKLGQYNLESLIKRVYEAGYDDGKLGKIGIDFFDFWTVAKYCRLDCAYEWMLWKDLSPRLEAQKLTGVFRLEMDVLETLIYMDLEGALVDTKEMDAVGQRLVERMTWIRRRLHKEAGKVWSLDNAAEKGWFVYDVRKHKPRVFTEKTKQRSTRAEDLEVYGKDPMVALMLEYAECAKLNGTYVVGMKSKLVEDRLHPSFLQWGTETGRFSCAAPNLQNLPRETEERTEAGYSIRSFFIAPPGHSLIVSDYSQIEYRLFAHFSQDPFMVEMFNRGFDAHTAMASLITNKDPKDLSPEERTIYGKTVNFALGFGAGYKRLAATAGISHSRAKAIFSQHEQRSPRFYAWKRKVVSDARAQRPPTVRTILGRKRRLPTLFASDDYIRSKAERQAVSHRVQGSAADILKIGMVHLHRETVDMPIQMILTVHDELVTVVPEGMEGEATEIIREAMEGAYQLRVPLIADIKVCKRWSDGK